MASFTGVGDTTDLTLARKGAKFTVALSGTYDMKIALQREVAKGAGAWETLKFYDSALLGANATVSEVFDALEPSYHVRLIVVVDTSGTCTATISDVDGEELVHVRDEVGNTLYQIYEGGTIVPKRTPVVLTAATDLTREKHAFRPLLLTNATGFKTRLPNATGSGDEYEFFVVTTVTSGSHELNAFEIGDDDVNGVIVGVDPPGDEFTWGAQGTENMVSLGGTSNATGGFKGDRVRFVDIAAGLWSVSGHITQDGTEASPFGTDS